MARANIRENSVEFEVTVLTNLEFKQYCDDNFVKEVKALNPMVKILQIETQENEKGEESLALHAIIESKIVKDDPGFLEGMCYATDVFMHVVCDMLNTKSETALFYKTFKEYSVKEEPKVRKAPEAHDLDWYVRNYENLTPAQKEEAVDLAMNIKDFDRKHAIMFLKKVRKHYVCLQQTMRNEEQQSNEEDWD